MCHAGGRPRRGAGFRSVVEAKAWRWIRRKDDMTGDSVEDTLFPRTRWTQLGRAAASESDELDRLIRLYWGPLKVFLLATFPSLRNDADIVLQEFAEEKFLKKDWLNRADRNRGRFRDFLKSSLRNFAIDRLKRFEATHPPVALSDVEHELPGPQDPSEAFDLVWARTILAQTLERMEADCKNPAESQPRRSYIWEMFRIRVLAPIFEDAEPVPYDELIERFSLRTPTDASNMLLSAKRIFKTHLNKVVAEFGERDAATATEVKALVEFVQRLAKGA